MPALLSGLDSCFRRNDGKEYLIFMPLSPATKRWLGVAGVILAIAGFTSLSFLIDFERYLAPARLADMLQETGPMAPLVFIGLMAAAVVVSPIPSLPLDLAAGATFGPWLGTTYAVIGAQIGAVLSFLIGRALGRELISRLLRREVAFCERCSDHHLVILVLVSRLVPVFSFDVISYGAGLTNMSLAAFALATFVGMIPPTFALVYFGSSVVSAQLPLILAGAAMVAVFLLAPKLVARYPSAWWARLFLAAQPAAQPVRRDEPVHVETPAPERCGGCGASLP